MKSLQDGGLGPECSGHLYSLCFSLHRILPDLGQVSENRRVCRMKVKVLSVLDICILFFLFFLYRILPDIMGFQEIRY